MRPEERMGACGVLSSSKFRRPPTYSTVLYIALYAVGPAPQSPKANTLLALRAKKRRVSFSNHAVCMRTCDLGRRRQNKTQFLGSVDRTLPALYCKPHVLKSVNAGQSQYSFTLGMPLCEEEG